MYRKRERSLNDPSRYRKIIKETKQLNPELTIRILSELFEVSDKTVESWMYEDKGSPNLGHIMTLWFALRRCKCKMPRDLPRATNLAQVRGRQVAKLFQKGIPEAVGEKLQEHNSTYIFRGELLTIPEISKKSGYEYSLVRGRVQRLGLAPGSDITEEIIRPRYERRKS